MHIYFIIDKQKSIVYKSKYLFVPILNEQGHHLNVNKELMEMKRHPARVTRITCPRSPTPRQQTGQLKENHEEYFICNV